MDQREAVISLRGIWAAKAEHEASLGNKMPLPDFLNEHLHKKYSQSPLVAQTIYNLLHSAGQHTYDPELLLFLKVTRRILF
jgi:hypothetical protein